MQYPPPLRIFMLIAVALVFLAPASYGSAVPDKTVLDSESLQKDWFFQAKYRGKPLSLSSSCTTAQDAAGGCDGVKEGGYGFHTDSGPEPSWWQVDLERTRAISKVVLYNRPECPERAAHLALLLSLDGKTWREAYRHQGQVFGGAWDKRPLTVTLENTKARFVRVQVRAATYLHLDEVEVYGPESLENLALRHPADQSSTSQWSLPKFAISPPVITWPLTQTIESGLKLAADLRATGVATQDATKTIEAIAREAASAPEQSPAREQLYYRVCAATRELALANPLLNFDSVLFVKRRPGTFSHMSDQYYSWFARPGGGVFILKNFKSKSPKLQCLTESFAEGSFLSPDLSYDAKKLLFAYCRYYPDRNNLRNKLDKLAQPEDSFYHIFEMNVDGNGLRQLTFGRYDDVFPRYLPSGEIVFLSTRRGTHFQVGRQSAEESLAATLPDSFVRCGGDASRPVSIYTLHTVNADGKNMRGISAFESFEWDPSVGSDGRILYARWDYVDRNNMPYMKLWATHPDGANPSIIYGNHTPSPHCTFEPRSIPHSRKIILTASAHHCLTGGSLILFDPEPGLVDGKGPITRLTPEVLFPEVEGWTYDFYANPYPLSERYYLCAWGGPIGPGCPPNTWGLPAVDNALGIYLFDTAGNLELLYRDPAISSMYPIPLCPRPVPPVLASVLAAQERQEGSFLLQDIYAGLDTVPRGSIKRLRVVAIPVKTQPDINTPNLGLTVDDPGKCVLGTVPVEPDGSAHFVVPSGVPVFFQALDADGRAIQTMRSATYVQPGQTLACVGCHEARSTTPPLRSQAILASHRVSRLKSEPEGSWPLRFDQLVQPVLDRHCVACHQSKGADPRAAKFDLTASHAWLSLVNYGQPSLADQIRDTYRRGRSLANGGPAQTSALMGLLGSEKGHHDVQLDADSRYRLSLWMDTYAQRQGSFSLEQEESLREFRRQMAAMIE